MIISTIHLGAAWRRQKVQGGWLYWPHFANTHVDHLYGLLSLWIMVVLDTPVFKAFPEMHKCYKTWQWMGR